MEGGGLVLACGIDSDRGNDVAAKMENVKTEGGVIDFEISSQSQKASGHRGVTVVRNLPPKGSLGRRTVPCDDLMCLQPIPADANFYFNRNAEL